MGPPPRPQPETQETDMYKLLGNPKTRAGRVMWMLEELGVDYEINPCNPHDPAVAYVTVMKYKEGDNAPYAYRTDN